MIYDTLMYLMAINMVQICESCVLAHDSVCKLSNGMAKFLHCFTEAMQYWFLGHLRFGYIL